MNVIHDSLVHFYGLFLVNELIFKKSLHLYVESWYITSCRFGQ